ncbi:MAG: lysozyme [Caulobacterales bacterium]
MSISREGLDLLKSFEGFRPRAVPISGGRFLVGYGHTRYARAGTKVTPEEAELLLRHDLVPVVNELNTRIYAPLSQNQFDALALFAFNVGIDAFRDSQISAHLNAGEPLAAARRMEQWRTAMIDGRPVVVDALVRRRAGELDLFLRTPHAVRPASSSLVAPIQDGAPPAPPEPASSKAPPPEPSPPSVRAPFEPEIQAESNDEPPKPPSTLRTRFHDLLRAKRAPREPSLDISVREVGWAGPIILVLAAIAFAAVAAIGFGDLEAARAAGAKKPVLALAEAFGASAGALACLFAAVRLLLEKLRYDSEAPSD